MTGSERISIICIGNNEKRIRIVGHFVRQEAGIFLPSKSSEQDDDLLTNLKPQISDVINALGEESAVAQGLKKPITIFDKFLNGSIASPVKRRDFIYIAFKVDLSNNQLEALGFIRVGYRSLFFDHAGELCKVDDCLAALDFYLRQRRCGLGYLLLSTALKECDKTANKCAYDRPTSAMLSFLEKHFALGQPRFQHNHYVIFDSFF